MNLCWSKIGSMQFLKFIKDFSMKLDCGIPIRKSKIKLMNSLLLRSIYIILCLFKVRKVGPLRIPPSFRALCLNGCLQLTLICPFITASLALVLLPLFLANSPVSSLQFSTKDSNSFTYCRNHKIIC